MGTSQPGISDVILHYAMTSWTLTPCRTKPGTTCSDILATGQQIIDALLQEQELARAWSRCPHEKAVLRRWRESRETVDRLSHYYHQMLGR